MKKHLLIIVLLLVLVPTAWLSLLASRALEARELTLRAELEARADNAIQAVAGRVRTRLDDDLDQIRSALSQCLSRGGRYDQVDKVARELAASRELVGQVYLFLHPWGMMYPQEPEIRGQRSEISDEVAVAASSEVRAGWDFVSEEGWPEEYRDMVQALRAAAPSGSVDVRPIHLNLDGVGFCFGPMQAGRSLYVGYSVNQSALMAFLAKTTLALSGGEIVLSYDGLDKGKVLVQDSFDGVAAEGHRPFQAQVAPLLYDPNDPLASGMLLPPFESFKLRAFLKDPEAATRAGRLYGRLFFWGILLLAAGIVAGVWIVFQQTAAEVRLARARSDFVIGVSHDLRTPVSSMKMLAESLQMGRVPDKEKQKQFLATITRECDRLADMIERVLLFMREEQGAAIYSFEPTDIGAVVAEAVDDFSARRHGPVDIVLSCAADLPSVRADCDALAKVLFNLFDNAVKYSKDKTRGDSAHAGEAPVTRIDVAVDRRERRGRDWVVIRVKDHGIGIEHKELKRVFRKFYRASLEAAGNVGGIGLGLAICKRIVQAHKGRIEVASSIGEGSTFTIYLPLAGTS